MFVSDNPMKFENLSESTQETALDLFREYNLDYEWYDSVFDDAKAIGKLMGIDISDIHFSGFSCQGDGAQFEGYYEYSKGCAAAVRDYVPKDERLHKIVDRLVAIQRPSFYQMVANVKSEGTYSHEFCTRVTVDTLDNYDIRGGVAFDDKIEEELTDALRDYMRWIYRRLEADYNYLQSRESLVEHFESNEYEFDGDTGALA